MKLDLTSEFMAVFNVDSDYKSIFNLLQHTLASAPLTLIQKQELSNLKCQLRHFPSGLRGKYQFVL